MLLADIWAEIFDLPDISRDDDFFNLGGDSLSGAIVAARIHASLGVDLTLGEIADHPTVLALAAFIDDCRRAGLRWPAPNSSRSSRQHLCLRRPFRSSSGHHRENRVALTSVNVHRVIGPLDIEILKECLSYLIDRHEILRTTFGLVEGRVAQIIHPSAPLDFSFIDLIDADDPEGQAEFNFRQRRCARNRSRNVAD